MASKEYTIVDGVIFNGARDTEGGIWIRVNDDEDHRILGSAVSKQIKNTEAAKGTLSALDPNAPHMVDYIINSLNRVLASVNGARPASAQLAGTPIGDALAATPGKMKGGGGRKRKGADGGKVAGSIGEHGEHAIADGEIQWADDVSKPRPRVGDAFWPALQFANTIPQLVATVIGYDAENGHFVVANAAGEKASILFNPEWESWTGAGAQPTPPSATTSDEASAAVKQLIAALRSGPADLEDAQFEVAASVARILLLIVATANKRADQVRSVAEYIDEYRTNAENAVELAGGIEYDLAQAVSLDAFAADESDAGEPGEPSARSRPAAKKAAAKKPAAKSGKGASASKGAAGKSATKRKR